MKKYSDVILHGGDYNPEQWPEHIWHEDMSFFKDANINTATINVFSWVTLQPSEEEYSFKELDAIVDLLSKENHNIVMATSTASLPAWMFKRYPEVARTDFYGRQHKFGHRHNACPNSLVYQKYASLLVEKLSERYSKKTNIAYWHINNELGGECYCDNCAKAFRVWLRKKYKTLDNLNKAWSMTFWGHNVQDWDDVLPPNVLTEQRKSYNATDFAGMSIDYRRFNSDSVLNTLIMERDAIRKYDKKTPITNNFKGLYKNFDYFKWAKEVDVVSWDNYPKHDTPMSLVAMTHDLMRGTKREPFLLVEQSPSSQNWQPYNALKKPGQMRALSYQTLAHGGESILYFQLRRSAGGCEKFHGSVIEHSGSSDTRVFKEVAKIGAELKSLGNKTIGSCNKSDVGVIFDWDNWSALEYTSGPNKDLKYVDQIHHYYEYFYKNNIPVDMVSPYYDLSEYKVIIAPVLYMIKEGMAEALDAFVKQGGILVLTYMSGIVDQSDNVHLGGYPGPLRKMAGVWVEEIDALRPEQNNTVIFNDNTQYECTMLCDLIRLEGAKEIAQYGSDFYVGTPAVTVNNYGEGKVFYIGTMLNEGARDRVFDIIKNDSSLRSSLPEKTELEVTCRHGVNYDYYFVLNFTNGNVKLPTKFSGKKDLFTNKLMDENVMLKPFDVFLFEMEK